ncbi:hypothetical protein [Helicobacter rodentium]|nr:hypothetical protein [Helicobacter rodentium]
MESWICNDQWIASSLVLLAPCNNKIEKLKQCKIIDLQVWVKSL